MGSWLDVGPVDDLPSAWLSSLDAIMRDGARLADRSRLSGAFESMKGVMIFGLTTAFLFNAMSKLRSVTRS